MAEIPRNPLSCTRCKAKKIKCGREEPTCDKCKATRADCNYPTRRQKAQHAKKRANILSEILQRLDTLERKVGVPTTQRNVTEDAISHGGDDISGLGDEDGSSDSDDTQTENETPFKTLYQLMDEAANTTKDVFDNAPEEATPNPNTGSLFNDALTSIRSFRFKDDKGNKSSEKLHVPPELAYRWIEAFFAMDFYEELIGASNKGLMMAMPTIMTSPNVQVHYSVIVVYYNVLFCGLRCDPTSSPDDWNNYGRKFYRECLKLVPAWKNDGLPATTMDFIATGLMTLMAVENFDYHLGWDLHLACCAIARDLRLDRLDDVDLSKRPEGYENESDRNSMRKKIWQLIHLEFFFRLYYDKSPTITGSDFCVDFPTITETPGCTHTADTIYFLVSSRYVFINKEFFDTLQKSEEDAKNRVESLADQMENSMVEWNLHGLLTSSSEDLLHRWMYADLMVNGYVTIILMERKAFGSKAKRNSPSSRSVSAARRALETMNTVSRLYGNQSQMFMNFTSFYPFVAFFTLYHHILTSIQQQHKFSRNQLDEIERDTELMESLSALFSKLSTWQQEFSLLANAVSALNKASRHLMATSIPNTPASMTQTPPTSHSLRFNQNKGNTPTSVGGPSIANDIPFDWTMSSGHDWPQMEATFQQHGLQTPLLYVESMENDLFGKNWHQSWWDQ